MHRDQELRAFAAQPTMTRPSLGERALLHVSTLAVLTGLFGVAEASAQDAPVYHLSVKRMVFEAIPEGKTQPCISYSEADVRTPDGGTAFVLGDGQPSDLFWDWTPAQDAFADTCDDALLPKIHFQGSFRPTFVEPGPDGDFPLDDFQFDNTTFSYWANDCVDGTCRWHEYTGHISFDDLVTANEDYPGKGREFLNWHTGDENGGYTIHLFLQLQFVRVWP